MPNDSAIVAAYSHKEVPFRFRGTDLRFALSHGLFSSADVDVGSRLLLKAWSAVLDKDRAEGRPLPLSVLDAGCGAGILGIAAARALREAGAGTVRLRAQDRDELAAVFTRENARRNGLDEVDARAEGLLVGVGPGSCDLILSNLPAKAGSPVLADFFARAGRSLAAGGRCAVVIVATLAADARRWMEEAGVPLLAEEAGAEHVVFIHGPAPAPAASRTARAETGEGASAEARGYGHEYLRGTLDFELPVPSGTARFRVAAFQGVADFDEPSRACVLAARLYARLGGPAPAGSVLVHEGDQGHLACALAAGAEGSAPPRIVLAGRNALALEASRRNALAARGGAGAAEPTTVPAVDLGFAEEALIRAGGPFDLVASFPERVPRVDRDAAAWDAAARLVAPGGLFILAGSSVDAVRFDKLKRGPFARAGDLKKDGFRALAYRRT